VTFHLGFFTTTLDLEARPESFPIRPIALTRIHAEPKPIMALLTSWLTTTQLGLGSIHTKYQALLQGLRRQAFAAGRWSLKMIEVQEMF